MSLCVQADVEKFLQIDISAEPEPAVTMLIENAQAVIETYCDRTFEAESSITETLDGPGIERLLLSKWPITTVTSVTEDGVTLTVADDYLIYANTGELARGSSTTRRNWTSNRQAVTVVYDAGYTDVPHDIRDVCTRMVARAFQAASAFANAPAGASSIREISLEGSDSVKYSKAVWDVASAAVQLTDEDRDVLDPWRTEVMFV